jgi:hypothetical protein
VTGKSLMSDWGPSCLVLPLACAGTGAERSRILRHNRWPIKPLSPRSSNIGSHTTPNRSLRDPNCGLGLTGHVS